MVNLRHLYVRLSTSAFLFLPFPTSLPLTHNPKVLVLCEEIKWESMLEDSRTNFYRHKKHNHNKNESLFAFLLSHSQVISSSPLRSPLHRDAHSIMEKNWILCHVDIFTCINDEKIGENLKRIFVVWSAEGEGGGFLNWSAELSGSDRRHKGKSREGIREI